MVLFREAPTIVVIVMNDRAPAGQEQGSALKRGWTTGACATAATRAALSALLGGDFPDPVAITLPGGQRPFFALAHEKLGPGFAQAGIIKDAGDDPDVTHGVTVISRLSKGAPGTGIVFCAGEGVGIITKPGLKLAVGQGAINPVPRKMMAEVITALCAGHGCAADIKVTIKVPGGEEIAEKTWNPRLGITGGISILGTSGIVIPYSCSAWVHSIHSGIDVARAMGLKHIVGATGAASENAARQHFSLPPEAFIDMGDFVGGLLKYLRTHPVERVSIAGGFAKMSKLANGAMDLHSARSRVDRQYLGNLLLRLGAEPGLVQACQQANSAGEILNLAQKAGFNLGQEVAKEARASAAGILKEPNIVLDIVLVDQQGRIVGRTGENG